MTHSAPSASLRTASPCPTASPGFYALWIAACGLAELAAFAGAAGWWVIIDLINPDPVTLWGKLLSLLGKTAAGIVEGGLLGSVQALMLRRLYPPLPVTAWIAATIIVASAGWAAGSAVPIFLAGGGPVGAEPPVWLVAAATSLVGLLAGTLFGAAQAFVLRRVAYRTWAWVIANAAGWAVALPVLYVAASGNGDGGFMLVGRLVLAGAGAGAVIGAATSLAFGPMRGRVASLRP